MKPDLDAVLAKVVTRALVLPAPRMIVRDVLANSEGADNGLRAQSFDGPAVRGGSTDSHPERMVELRNQRRHTRLELDVMRAITRASESFVDAISALMAECRDAPPADDWEDALHLANLLAGLGEVQAAADVGRNVTTWVHRADKAITVLEGVHNGYKAHPPTNDQALREERCCLSHARIGDYTRSRCGDLAVCKTCRDWIDIIAEPVTVHLDPDFWPSEEMLRGHADFETSGKRKPLRDARKLWVDRKGGPRRRSA